MITQREIDDLVQELKDGGFYCAFVNKKLNVIFNGTRIMAIDFERRVIEFVQRPINPKDNPRFSYFMGRIWGVLWGKEDKKYSLRLPNMFNQSIAYLNYDPNEHDYFFSTIDDSKYIQTEFTQSEIDKMPFDTSFFIKEEVK